MKKLAIAVLSIVFYMTASAFGVGDDDLVGEWKLVKTTKDPVCEATPFLHIKKREEMYLVEGIGKTPHPDTACVRSIITVFEKGCLGEGDMTQVMFCPSGKSLIMHMDNTEAIYEKQ